MGALIVNTAGPACGIMCSCGGSKHPAATYHTMPLNTQNLRGVADVVFVMDISPSMEPVIEDVKNHIATFVDSVHRHSQSPVDLRLGLVAHEAADGDRWGSHAWDFTGDGATFRQQLATCDRLAQASEEYEFGLPALDRALDFPWRPLCRRFLVSFTDEPVSGGHRPDFQRSRLQELAAKFAVIGVNGYLIGPACPDYDALCRGPRMVRVTLDHEDLARYDFGPFLSELGRTVSASPNQPCGTAPANLYGL